MARRKPGIALVDGLDPVAAPMTRSPVRPPTLTVDVTLNERDADLVWTMAEDEYRTPAQQVGWIVSQWLKIAAKTGLHGPPASTQPPASPAAGVPSPMEPALLPVYHVGDGSAGSGCGKVGLLFSRRLKPGDTVQPGDVFRTTGEILSGPLLCCQCGGVMNPATWSFEG